MTRNQRCDKLVNDYMHLTKDIVKKAVHRIESERNSNTALWNISESDVESMAMDKLLYCAMRFTPSLNYEGTPEVQFEKYLRRAIKNGLNTMIKNITNKALKEASYISELKYLTIYMQEDVAESVCNNVLDNEINNRIKLLVNDKIRADLSDIKASISKDNISTLSELARKNGLTINQIATDQQNIKKAFLRDERLLSLSKERLNLNN